MRTTNKLLVWIVAGLLVAFMAGPPVTETLAASTKPTVPPKQQQLSGSVVSCDENELVVRSKKGKETKLTITIETQFGPKGAIKNAADFKPGNHVQVTYVKGDDGKLVAKQVVPIVTRVIK